MTSIGLLRRAAFSSASACWVRSAWGRANRIVDFEFRYPHSSSISFRRPAGMARGIPRFMFERPSCRGPGQLLEFAASACLGCRRTIPPWRIVSPIAYARTWSG